MMRILGALRLLFFWVLLAGVASAAQAKSFLWEAERDGERVWLMGSIHVGRADLYPLAPAIEAAYKESDAVAVEADVTDFTAIAPLMAMAMLPADQSVGAMLSPAQNRQLDRVLARINLPRVAADRMKPWLLGLMLSIMEMQRLGYQPQNGIDMHLLQRARTDGKKVVELESLKSQFDLLDGLSTEESLAVLLGALEPIAKQQFKPMFEAMVVAWQNGNVAAMRRLIEENIPNDAVSRRLNDKLLAQRNRGMAERVVSLAGPKPALVVVGAAHLVGPDSLLELLKARGFRIKQY
ncbi:TraB/GumN family protein [Chitinimonas sp. BJYL2]|uniref:TraB/GumN family protein n=1 Tax=Chitinimonas sp. BJYL2 TaxID=2976696 RepID=UPI0022B2ECDE|nr:TraB/GumN family protein [Chitinimonas sp. BJYL2]